MPDLLISLRRGLITTIHATNPDLDAVIVDHDLEEDHAQRALVEPMDDMSDADTEALRALEKRETRRYNHALTIAFEARPADPEGPTNAEYRQGLLDRIAAIDAEPDGWAQVNVEAPFDTYEEGAR